MNKFSIEIKWAFIFSLLYLLWMYFEKIMGWHGESIGKQAIYSNIFAIFAILIYVFAIRDKRENFYNGSISWKKGFLSGAILSVIIAALTPISQYIVHTFISPGFFENIIAYRVENQLMEREFAENYYRLNIFMFQAAFYALSYGIVTAAVVAWFVKKKPENTDKSLE